MEKERVYVDIDVAKANMDAAEYPSGQQWSFTNDEKGINQAVSRLRDLSPALVVRRPQETLNCRWLPL